MLPTILAAFFLCFVLERLRPGWKLPNVRTWPLRVLAINAVQLAVVLLAGVSWERWLSDASLFQLSVHVSPAAGGLIAHFIATFVFYWWHRIHHQHDRHKHNYGDITWWGMLRYRDVHADPAQPLRHNAATRHV
jgi:sterol desaturase/sphingolipid hydroxylase (fatty acid hydroxylase superfamily)